VKKLFILVFFVIVSCSLVYAQSAETVDPEAEKEKPKFDFAMGINIGLSSYEDSTGDQIAFQKLSLLPEFSYGKWGIGFDFTFEFDGTFNLRDLDNDGEADTWTKFSDYFYKIYYVRYGQKGEPLYAKIGRFDSYTLGHGLLMEGFSNTLLYPYVQQLGLNLDVDGSVFGFPYIGIESVTDDVLDWDIIGVRIYTRPLIKRPIPILKGLEFGATTVVDFDPQEDPTSDDIGPPKDNPASDTVSTFGVDVGLPIFKKEKSSLIAYADWAIINEKGNGTVVGSTYRYDWFTLYTQLRFLGKQFVVNYFDPFYERERAVKFDSLDALSEFYMGYFIGTDFTILNFVTLFFYWQDGFDDAPGPRIQTGAATVENAIPKFDVSVSYDKKDVDGFGDFFDSENSLFQVRVAYKITDFARIVFIQQRTFTPSGDSASQTFVETQFSF
jgi:hypothetical protein